MKKTLLLLSIVFMLVTVLYVITSFTQIFKRNGENLPKINVIEDKIPVQNIPAVSIVAENLSIPWALAFLPDKRLLVNEREGKIKLIENGESIEIAEISVHSEGEGGLHGIAIDPEFENNNY